MMSIRTITTPPVALPAGILPAGAAAGESFAALLPAMMVPVMPMVPEDAGKVLPVAGSEDEEAPVIDGTPLWLAPSVVPEVCPKEAETVPGNVAPSLSLTVATLPRPLRPVVANPLTSGDAAPPVPGGTPAGAVPPSVTPLVSRPDASEPGMMQGPSGEEHIATPDSGLRGKDSSASGIARKVALPAATMNADRAAHLPTASAPASPVLPPAEASRIAPAAQVFAAAIQQVVGEERRPSAAEQAIAAIAPTTDLAAHAVTAAESSRHAALDMARDTWPAKMIERIEMLRDAANANDTGIRLVPDRLGTIDVSLRRDGDTVAVHFQAQHAETRQLIAEAQPRLADMAEARGLRLSTQTSDGGSHPQQQQQRAGTGTAPTNNVSPDAAQTGASSADERVA